MQVLNVVIGNDMCSLLWLVNNCYIQVIAAEGEQASARALKEAADVMSSSSSALQLRYLQTLNTIAAEKNSTLHYYIPAATWISVLRQKVRSTVCSIRMNLDK